MQNGLAHHRLDAPVLLSYGADQPLRALLPRCRSSGLSAGTWLGAYHTNAQVVGGGTLLKLGEDRSSEFFDQEERVRPASRGARSPGGDWPQEVRQLLQNMNREASALRAERRALTARVTELEQQLASAVADRRRLASRVLQLEQLEQKAREAPPSEQKSDDQWLAEVTDRTAYTLRSAQEAAQRLIARAKGRATEIEQAAAREAAEIRKRAEAEAEKLLLVAHYDAEGLLQGAQASGEEILARARERQETMLSRLQERRAALQAEIDELEAGRLSLLQRYAKIKASVGHAIHALEGDSSVNSQARPPSAGGHWARGRQGIRRLLASLR
jgi:cell division septum initiation protein DivIVA